MHIAKYVKTHKNAHYAHQLANVKMTICHVLYLHCRPPVQFTRCPHESLVLCWQVKAAAQVISYGADSFKPLLILQLPFKRGQRCEDLPPGFMLVHVSLRIISSPSQSQILKPRIIGCEIKKCLSVQLLTEHNDQKSEICDTCVFFSYSVWCKNVYFFSRFDTFIHSFIFCTGLFHYNLLELILSELSLYGTINQT